jgi:hypothetical protein
MPSCALQSVFVSMKDWRMALHCLQQMMDLAPQLAASLQSSQSEIGLVVDSRSPALSLALNCKSNAYLVRDESCCKHVPWTS